MNNDTPQKRSGKILNIVATFKGSPGTPLGPKYAFISTKYDADPFSDGNNVVMFVSDLGGIFRRYPPQINV